MFQCLFLQATFRLQAQELSKQLGLLDLMVATLQLVNCHSDINNRKRYILLG